MTPTAAMSYAAILAALASVLASIVIVAGLAGAVVAQRCAKGLPVIPSFPKGAIRVAGKDEKPQEKPPAPPVRRV